MFTKYQPIFKQSDSKVSLEIGSESKSFSQQNKIEEKKEEKYSVVRVYCLGKKIQNYSAETKESHVLVHGIQLSQHRIIHEVRSNINADELFNSFATTKKIPAYKRLKQAFARSNIATIYGSIEMDSHELWWGKRGVYADAYAVFAVDAEVKLSDYKKNCFDIEKSRIKKIAYVYFDRNIFYKNKSTKKYLEKFKLYNRIQIVPLLESYKRSLSELFNQALINRINTFMEKMQNAKKPEALYDLCSEERDQITKKEYKDILSAICDRLLYENEKLEIAMMNKFSGLKDSLVMADDSPREEFTQRWHVLEGRIG